MCEFISWIEVKREGKTLYLTDKEVFSKFGREKLLGTKDNDVLGHGAIRAYYGLEPGEGVEYEVRNFWETDKLPEEIREKLKDPASFDLHWGKIFSRGHFMKDDLRYIIYCAPEAWKAKAAEQLLTQNPTNNNLCYIINYAPKVWKAKAWEELLTQNPTNWDLCYIIYYAPEVWAEKAWEQLLAQNPTNGDLRYIIYYAPEVWRSKAWEQLLAQNPANYDLCYIIRYAPDVWKVKAQVILNSRK